MGLELVERIRRMTQQDVRNGILISIAALFALVLTVLFVLFYSKIFTWCDAFAKSTAANREWLHLLLAPICFFAGAGLCWKFAPEAVGNGVSKIRTALSKIERGDDNVEPQLGPRLIVTKAIASWICSLGGGALGREGPVVHLSAALFWLFGRHIKKWFPRMDLRHWIVGGSAIGFAVAFNTPLAGLIFAVEELSDDNLARGKLMTLWLVLLACVFQGFLMPVIPLFHFELYFAPWQEMLGEILITCVICGVLSALLKMTSEKAQQHVQARYPFWIVALVCGMAVGLIGVWAGGQSFGGGVITIQQAMRSAEPVIHFKECIARIANTLLSAFSGNAGGLLGPSVALGASIGSVVGDLVGMVDVRILMTCGMAAFLGGFMSMPLTAAILAFETTGQGPLILAFFLSGMMGHLTAAMTNYLFKKNTDINGKAE